MNPEGFPIDANSFMYLSDAGIYAAGAVDCAVEGRELVPAGSDRCGGRFMGWAPPIGGLLTRRGHGRVIVKEMFFRSSFA